MLVSLRVFVRVWHALALPAKIICTADSAALRCYCPGLLTVYPHSIHTACTPLLKQIQQALGRQIYNCLDRSLPLDIVFGTPLVLNPMVPPFTRLNECFLSQIYARLSADNSTGPTERCCKHDWLETTRYECIS